MRTRASIVIYEVDDDTDEEEAAVMQQLPDRRILVTEFDVESYEHREEASQLTPEKRETFSVIGKWRR